MFKKVDRILLRVPSLPAAVKYYTETLGLRLIRQDKRLASLAFAEDDTELVLHVDEDLPDEATYYLVENVRELYANREKLKLTFVSPPSQASRGWRATIKDPFGLMFLVLDRTGAESAEVEDAKPAGTLFGGVESKVAVNREALVAAYTRIARTADDLPYTPHFESLYKEYASGMNDPKPTRAETWRHLLNMRKKKGQLPKFGEAKSRPPEILPEDRDRLRLMLGESIGKRDRLPYTPEFDLLVDEFNKTQTRPISPHLVWRLIATLAK